MTLFLSSLFLAINLAFIAEFIYRAVVIIRKEIDLSRLIYLNEVFYFCSERSIYSFDFEDILLFGTPDLKGLVRATKALLNFAENPLSFYRLSVDFKQSFSLDDIELVRKNLTEESFRKENLEEKFKRYLIKEPVRGRTYKSRLRIVR